MIRVPNEMRYKLEIMKVGNENIILRGSKLIPDINIINPRTPISESEKLRLITHLNFPLWMNIERKNIHKHIRIINKDDSELISTHEKFILNSFIALSYYIKIRSDIE